MILIVIFIVGCIFGSFLCVLIDRLPRGEQVLKGRSYCENCKHVLGPIDLVPLFSYITTQGKCRYCNSKIPFHLFLLELLTGLTFLSLYIYTSYSAFSILHFVFFAVIFTCFIGIFFADWFSGIIPDEFNVVIGVTTLLLLILIFPGSLINHLVSAIVVFLLFLFLFIATRGRGMGFGDVKFAFLMGLFLGFPSVVVGLYAAFLTAALVSMILILLKKKKFRGDTIAFGPFLIFGTIFAYFLSDKVLSIIF